MDTFKAKGAPSLSDDALVALLKDAVSWIEMEGPVELSEPVRLEREDLLSRLNHALNHVQGG
jgi:hypothetical protein